MKFLRPEATALLSRWSEAIIFGLGLLLCLYILLRNIGSPFWMIIAGLAAFFCAVNLYHGVVRARLGSDGSAQGVVLIDEHRIGYFGPDTGGFVDLGNLTRLDVYNGKWILHGQDGARLDIPFDAPKADGLLDLFAQLQGVTLARLHSALATRQGLLQTIFERAP